MGIAYLFFTFFRLLTPTRYVRPVRSSASATLSVNKRIGFNTQVHPLSSGGTCPGPSTLGPALGLSGGRPCPRPWQRAGGGETSRKWCERGGVWGRLFLVARLGRRGWRSQTRARCPLSRETKRGCTHERCRGERITAPPPPPPATPFLLLPPAPRREPRGALWGRSARGRRCRRPSRLSGTCGGGWWAKGVAGGGDGGG